MKVIITAGGTGGHIYPALAILNKIKEKEKNCEILYIGTHNRMEKDIVPKEGYNYEALEIYGFSKTEIKRNFKNIKLIFKAKKRCLEIMKEFKPDIVIGVGGYVTYPVIKAANKLKIKTFIHEQNSIPGKTNKNLGKIASLIGVSFKDSLKYFDKDKVIFTGNPSSENALDIKATPKTKYGLDRNKKSIVIVQGSLGSSAINKKMKDFLENISKETYDVLYIKAKGRGSHCRTNVDKYGFPRGYLARRKYFYGFQTGDMVRAIVSKGKYRGTWYGEVACRKTGYFDIKNKEGQRVVQGINYKYFKVVQKFDGYSYRKEEASLTQEAS